MPNLTRSRDFLCRRVCVTLVTILCLSGCGKRSEDKPVNTTDPTRKATPAKEELMLTVQNEPFAETDEGTQITAYSLKNKHGLKVMLSDLGATLVSVETPDREGKLANICLAYPEPATYLKNPSYFGGICGRYSNRIAKGKFTLDDKEYSLATNNGPNHLHGGTVGFIHHLWKAVPSSNETGSSLTFTRTSPDGEEGYPGQLEVKVVYTLNDQNELTIDYTATTDKPTVVNLTNHAYWDLAGAGNGTVTEQLLTLSCDKYLPVDETSIPTGELAAVDGTCMDFREPHKIGERIDQAVNGGGGYDHCWVVNGAAGKLRPAAKVVDPKSGRTLEIQTTAEGIQFYTANHFSGEANSAGAPKFGAFCLETQKLPDSPNRPEFPTATLRPGETYRHTTVHRFGVEKNK